MTASESRPDPWSAGAPSPGRRLGSRGVLRSFAVALLAGWGVAARIYPDTSDPVRMVGLIAAMALALALALAAARRVTRLLGTLAAVAVGSSIIVPMAGRAPVLVLIIGVLVGHAALVQWQPWPTHPRRSTVQASLAIPFLVVAGLTWSRGDDGVATLGLYACAMAVTEFYAVVPQVGVVADRWIDRWSRALGNAVGATILFIGVLTLMYLPGLIGKQVTARQRARDCDTSSWRPIEVDVAAQRRDARFPFASESPAAARRRLLGGMVVASLVAWTMWAVLVDDDKLVPAQVATPTDAPPVEPAAGGPPVIFGREFAARYTDLPAYRGVAWADELQVEEAGVPLVETFRGRYVNLRDGRRVTVPPPDCDCRDGHAWLTGASSVWGIGQRDDHTIASNLVRSAVREGVSLRVDNMGQRGTTIEDQVDEVERRLASGDVPDTIIFMNGFNEIGVGLTDEMLRDGSPNAADLVGGDEHDLAIGDRMEDLEAVNGRVQEYLASGVGPEVGLATADRYRAQVQRMEVIADRYDLQVRFFLQPDALASRHQLEPYELISGVPTELMAASPLPAALETMATDLEGEVIDLRHLFDDESAQVFLGLMHHNEDAAEAVAEAMLPHLLELLE